MATKTKAPRHTPLPWHVGGIGGARPAIIYGPDGWAIASAETYHEANKDEADAEFIVRAANSHYDLLDACVAAYGTITRRLPDMADGSIVADLRDAIAIATRAS